MPKASKTKLEYEQLFNKIFGTNIRWSRLTVRELEELARALTEKADNLCQTICKETKVLAGFIDKIIPPEEQGPFIKLIKELLNKIE